MKSRDEISFKIDDLRRLQFLATNDTLKHNYELEITLLEWVLS